MNKKTVIRVIVLVLIGAIAVSAAAMYKQSRTRELEAQTKREAEAAVHAMPSYSEHAAYLDGIVASAHPAVWDANFKTEMVFGGTVNASAYQRDLLARVIDRLNEDKQGKLRQELELAMIRLGISAGDPTDELEEDGTAK